MMPSHGRSRRQTTTLDTGAAVAVLLINLFKQIAAADSPFASATRAPPEAKRGEAHTHTHKINRSLLQTGPSSSL